MTNIEKLEFWINEEINKGLIGINVSTYPDYETIRDSTAEELAGEILDILEATPVVDKEFINAN